MKNTFIRIGFYVGALAFALLFVLFLLTGCATNSDGSQTVRIGSTTINIPAADVQAANATIDTAISGALNGTETQLLTTGSVDGDKLAAQEIRNSTAALAPYVGAIAPPTVISSNATVSTIGNSIAKTLANVKITQALIDRLNAQADKLDPASP